MTEEQRKIYRVKNREVMRRIRKREKAERLLADGRCPRCTILLNAEYEQWHKGCSWYENNHVLLEKKENV